jgi:hypothetical protein
VSIFDLEYGDCGDGFEGYGYERRPSQVECKHCSKGGLHWEETDEGWRLYDSGYRKHVCDTGRAHRLISDDFDNLED